MIEHTPGPWRYEFETRTVRTVPGNHWLGTLDSWDGAVVRQRDANGALMAAAPDMLKELEAIAESLASHPDAARGDSKVHYALMRARAGIAKAKGRGA